MVAVEMSKRLENWGVTPATQYQYPPCEALFINQPLPLLIVENATTFTSSLPSRPILASYQDQKREKNAEKSLIHITARTYAIALESKGSVSPNAKQKTSP